MYTQRLMTQIKHFGACTKQPQLTLTFSYWNVSSSVGVMAKIARLWVWKDSSNKNSPLNFQRTSMMEVGPDVADVSCVLHLKSHSLTQMM